MSRFPLEQSMHQAVELHRAGKLREAESIYRQALAAYPDHPDVLHLLGVALVNQQRASEGVELIRRAIAQHPNVTDFHYNLGLGLLNAGQPDQAVPALLRAIELRPDLASGFLNLAVALARCKRFPDAIAAAKRGVELEPKNPDQHNTLGVVLKDSGAYPEALTVLEQALRLRRDFPEALTNLGNVLQRMKRYDEAIASHRRALALTPDVPEILNNLGKCQHDAGQLDDAIATYRRAIEIRPNYPDALCSLASALHRSGRNDEAIAACEKAVAHRPEWALPKTNLGMMYLYRGDFERGWPLHEHRFAATEMGFKSINWGAHPWAGEDLTGKTILLHAEQGFGDTIQFARYIPMVKARGGRVVVGAQPPVVRLLRSIKEADYVFSERDPWPKYDVRYPLMSLPLIFKTTLQNVPATVPYLWADPGQTARWRERVPDDSRLKIGLVWAGRPTHENDHNRSMQLSEFAALASIPNVWFCSLQKGPAADQIKAQSAIEMTDWTNELDDLADSAALVANLDLVITVDTVIAHLAGAMGRPVWVLLPFVPDWRWMADREDSPWYPAMRLFRQSRAKDWLTPIERLTQALAEFRR